MARRSFFRTLGDALDSMVKGLAGAFGGGGAPAPPPPSAVYEEPPPPPPTTTFFPTWEYQPEPGNVEYRPRHTQFYVNEKYGKIYSGNITGRWTVGHEIDPPDASDMRDLSNSIGGKTGWTTFVVGGLYMTDYPGQEGRRITYLSYVWPIEKFDMFAEDPDVESATDVINELLAASDIGEHWEAVFEVSIIDN